MKNVIKGEINMEKELVEILKQILEVAISFRTNEHKTDWQLNNANAAIKKAQELVSHYENAKETK